MSTSDNSPATKSDILSIHDRLNDVAVGVSSLGETVARLDERQSKSEEMLQYTVRTLSGEPGAGNPGNGGTIGLVRIVDGNTRFKHRCVFWCKWLAGLVSGVVLTVLGIVVARCLGGF